MEYKQINNIIVCVRDNGTVLYGPDTSQYAEDEAIPWLETDREIVRLPDYSFVFADDPAAFVSLKVQKKADVAAARYAFEIAGVVYNGVRVTTDREDQAMITAVALSAVVDSTFTTVWKGADGYLDLDAAGVLTLARMVGAHVEAAFAEEKRLAGLIDAAKDKETLSSISWTM